MDDTDKELRSIPNIGSTCYMNCIIHLLNSVDEFRDFVLNLKLSEDCFLFYFQFIFKWLNCEIDRDNKDLKLILKVFKSYCGEYASDRQEDASHFLLFIIKSLNDEIKEKFPDDETNITDIFQGIETYDIECRKCEDSSKQTQTFYYLGLTLSNNKIELGELLKIAHVPYQIKDADCYMCKSNEIYASYAVKTWPQYLIINLTTIELSRFSILSKKKSKVSVHKLVFNVQSNHNCIKSNCSNLCSSNGQDSIIQYNVVGTIHHNGVAYFGHYRAFIQKGDKWLIYDDDKISKTQSSNIVTNDCIILLCKRAG